MWPVGSRLEYITGGAILARAAGLSLEHLRYARARTFPDTRLTVGYHGAEPVHLNALLGTEYGVQITDVHCQRPGL